MLAPLKLYQPPQLGRPASQMATGARAVASAGEDGIDAPEAGAAFDPGRDGMLYSHYVSPVDGGGPRREPQARPQPQNRPPGLDAASGDFVQLFAAGAALTMGQDPAGDAGVAAARAASLYAANAAAPAPAASVETHQLNQKA